MNDVVVIFRKDLPPQILHGQDGSKYKGNPKALINPVFPRDENGHVVPPHEWNLTDMINGPQQTKRIASKIKYYALGCLSGILIAVVCYLIRKIL